MKNKREIANTNNINNIFEEVIYRWDNCGDLGVRVWENGHMGRESAGNEARFKLGSF